MISLLVAYDKNRIIGARGQIPWKLNSERRRFKQICTGKTIIMGRKSYEEIGHPLSYCKIAIISKTLTTPPEGCLLFDSLEKGIRQLVNESISQLASGQLSIEGEQEILVAGGGEIYEQALPLASRIYATEIDAEFEGDTYFPKLGDDWKKVEEQTITDDLLPYKYVTYEKKNR